VEVAVIDSGGGNLGSLRHAFRRLGVPIRISAEADVIRGATHVVLPGVGAANPAMQSLRARGLDKVLHGLQQPLLGICLGMQLLFDRSEEGNVAGLGLLPGRVQRLHPRDGLRVPHMGWNALRIGRPDALVSGLRAAGEFVYFVHGYAIAETIDTLVTTDHGVTFASVVRRGNVCGMQFHPERSGVVGARLLANFLAL
jgi:glutamine amidotransferase